MKILKELALLAVTSAILYTGCANSFSGTDADDGVLARANSANNNLVVSLTSPAVGGALTAAANQVITLTFAAGDVIDSDTVDKAVIIRNLASAANATSVVTQGSIITYTVKEVRGNVVYLLLDLASASATIELFVDPTKLTGRGGTRKLDLDGDNVQGEAKDDDFYAYPNVSGGTAITTFGLQRNPRAGMGNLASAFSIVAPATTLNTFILNYTRQAGADSADYKTLFDATVVIEKYVAASNTWTTITPISNTYSTTTGDYTITFAALSAGENVRARYINIQNMKTTAEFQGYIQRAVMDSQVATFYGAFDSEADPLEISNGDTDTVFSSVSSVFTNGLKGLIVIDLDVATGSIIGDKGMDESSFTAANVKLYDTVAGVFVPFESVAFGYGAGTIPAATTDPKDQIVITLDPTYASSGNTFDIFVGPGLKTLGDVDLTPAARHFGDSANIDSSELYGFYGVTGVGSL